MRLTTGERSSGGKLPTGCCNEFLRRGAKVVQIGVSFERPHDARIRLLEALEFESGALQSHRLSALARHALGFRAHMLTGLDNDLLSLNN